MKKRIKITLYLFAGIAIQALIVAAVLGLWNLLVPAITGWTSIHYGQALGLTVLCRLLTGPLRLPAGRKRHSGHLHEKMHGMSREERKAFIREKLVRISDGEKDNEK